MKVTKYLKILILSLALTSLSGLTFADTIVVNNFSANPCDSDGLGACTSCDTDSVTEGDQCSLPAAITFANQTSDLDTINFDNNYTIYVTGDLPNIEEPLIIDGGIYDIEIVGNLGGGSTGFKFINNSQGSSLKALTINSFETQIKVDTIDGQTNGACADYITFEDIYVGTDTTGSSPKANQTVGLYVVDSKCLNITGSTFVISGTGFSNYNLRFHTVEDISVINSNIGITADRTTTVMQSNNFNVFSANNLSIINSYLTVDDSGGEIIKLQSSYNFYLARSYLGLDGNGAQLGSYDKAIDMDVTMSGITELSDLENSTNANITGCSETKSNICENYIAGSSNTDVYMQGVGHYFHGNQICSNVAQNMGVSTGDGLRILRNSYYNKFDSNIFDGCETNAIYVEEFDMGAGVYDLIFKDNEFGENITGKTDNALNFNGGGFPDNFDDNTDENIYANILIEGGFIKNSQTGISLNENNNIMMWYDHDSRALLSDIEIKNIAFGTGVSTGVYVGSDKTIFDFDLQQNVDYPISDIYLEGNTFTSVSTMISYAVGASADDQITQPTFSSVEVSGDTLTVSTTGGMVNAGEGCTFQVYFSNINGDIQSYLPSSGNTIVSFADNSGSCNLDAQEFDLSSITKVATSYFGLVLSQGTGSNKQSQIPFQTVKNLTTATPVLAISVTEDLSNNLIPFDTLITLDGSGSSDYSILNFDLDTNYDSDGDGYLDNDTDITLTSASPTTTFRYSDTTTYLNDNLLSSDQFDKTIKMTAVGELNSYTQNSDLKVFRAKISATPQSDTAPATILIMDGGLVPSGVSYSLDYGDQSNPETLYSMSGYNKVYSDPGQYTVTLTLTDENDPNQTHTDTVTVYSTETPVANFTLSASSLLATVDSNTSTGYGLEYEWDFDTSVDADLDGNPDNDVQSTEETPNYTFPADGTYDIQLRTTNSSGTSTTTESIQVNSTKPTITTFTANNGATIYVGDKINFVGTASNAVSYSWDFDSLTNSDSIGSSNDDIDSTLVNPSVDQASNPNQYFKVAGTYNVIFRATNSAGTTTLSLPITVSPVASGGGGGGSSSSYSPPSSTSNTTTTTTTPTTTTTTTTPTTTTTTTTPTTTTTTTTPTTTTTTTSPTTTTTTTTPTTTTTTTTPTTTTTTTTPTTTTTTPAQSLNDALPQTQLAQPKALNLQDSIKPSLETQNTPEQVPANVVNTNLDDQNSPDNQNLTGALIDQKQEADNEDVYVPAPQPILSSEELNTLFTTKAKISIPSLDEISSQVESDSQSSQGSQGSTASNTVTSKVETVSAKRAQLIKEAVQFSLEVTQEDKQVIQKLEINDQKRIQNSIKELDLIEQKDVAQEEKEREVSLNSDGDFCTDIYEKSIGTDPFTAGDCGVKEQAFVNNPLQAGQNILLMAKEKEVVPTDRFILNGVVDGYQENPIEDVCFYVETAVDYRLAGCSPVDANGNFIYYNDLQLTNPLSLKAEAEIQASNIKSGNQFKIVAESRDGSYKSLPVEIQIDITKRKDIPRLLSFGGLDGDQIPMSDDLLTNIETVQVSNDEVAAVLDIGTYAKGVVNFQSLLFSTASLTSSTSGVIQVVPPENYEFKAGSKHTFSAFAESLIDPSIKSEAVRINFEVVGSKYLIILLDLLNQYYMYALLLILVAGLILTTKKALAKVHSKDAQKLDMGELKEKEISDHEIEQSGLSSLGEKVQDKLEIDDSASKEGEELAKRNKTSLL